VITACELTVPLPRDSTVPFGRIVVLDSLSSFFPFLGFEFANPLFGAMPSSPVSLCWRRAVKIMDYDG
jgi:hypothetical protein